MGPEGSLGGPNDYRAQAAEFNIQHENTDYYAASEVFTAVTKQNAVLWDVAPCGFVRTGVPEESSRPFSR
jgi:hypothetical protein